MSGYEGSGYEINISEDTISNHIHALQKLGIPICERNLSVVDKKNQASLMAIYGDNTKTASISTMKNRSSPITPILNPDRILCWFT